MSAISLRRADFWNATGLGRWAMGDACHSGVDPRSSPLGAGAGMPPCGDPESSLFRPHLDRVLGDIPDGPSADWRRCPRLSSLAVLTCGHRARHVRAWLRYPRRHLPRGGQATRTLNGRSSGCAVMSLRGGRADAPNLWPSRRQMPPAHGSDTRDGLFGRPNNSICNPERGMDNPNDRHQREPIAASALLEVAAARLGDRIPSDLRRPLTGPSDEICEEADPETGVVVVDWRFPAVNPMLIEARRHCTGIGQGLWRRASATSI